MFAFSQIAAAGANPSAVIENLEKEASKPKPKPKNILNDDQAMAAFAEFMSGEGSDQVDPAKLAAEKKKKEEQAKAKAELTELTTNDATAAFAGLVESQEVESKAETFKGSAPDEDEEEAKPKAAPKKKAPAKKPKSTGAPKKKENVQKSADINIDQTAKKSVI